MHIEGTIPDSFFTGERPRLVAKEPKIKNECLKTRPRENPYEVWKSPDGQWTWNILKKYQVDDNKPYARWFCYVTSPICPPPNGGEYGDTYVKDIKSQGRKVLL